MEGVRKISLITLSYKEITAREAWLYENDAALTKVRKGLEDAAAGKLSRRR